MTTKHEKKGPELLIVDSMMLNGIETLAAQFRAKHDYGNYDFLTNIKTALTKYPAIAEQIAEQSKEARKISAQLLQWADNAEQLFPQNGINQSIVKDEK
jgi:hypothetical protein